MDKRVFWGVLCALLVFSALGAVGEVFRQQAEAQQFVESLHQLEQVSRDPDPLGARRLFARRQAEAERQRLLDLRRRALKVGERCIGGTVVEVNGSSYTQALGAQGRPVACSGRYRL